VSQQWLLARRGQGARWLLPLKPSDAPLVATKRGSRWQEAEQCPGPGSGHWGLRDCEGWPESSGLAGCCCGACRGGPSLQSHRGPGRGPLHTLGGGFSSPCWALQVLAHPSSGASGFLVFRRPCFPARCCVWGDLTPQSRLSFLLERFFKLHERKCEPIIMTVPRKVSATPWFCGLKPAAAFQPQGA